MSDQHVPYFTDANAWCNPEEWDMLQDLKDAIALDTIGGDQ